MTYSHISVLLNETIDSLNIKPNGIYVDGTVGGGGHSDLILSKLDSKGQGTLYCFDRDIEAIEATDRRLKGYNSRYVLIHDNYVNARNKLRSMGVSSIDGAILDLGVSSYQLDTDERGFSYMRDGSLDMRMDREDRLTAAEVVNTYDEASIAKIIWEYGEDNQARSIAKHIVRARDIAPIMTTLELVAIIDQAIPIRNRIKGGHSAKKTFQAIRIYCNRELDYIEDTIDGFLDLLSDGGRISVITFHSLEDRIVKNVFKNREKPCTCPPSFPVCICGNVSMGRVLTRKPILPSSYEMELNSRSKSAKLRVFERIV